MKLTKIAAALVVAGASLMSSSASALIVQDGWGMTALTSTTSNIGHLNLNGGEATVSQQINPITGLPFVGAAFSEYGLVFSTQYIQESKVGLGDSGFPQDFDSGIAGFDGLKVVFTDLAGTVTGFDVATGRIEYAFTPGVGSIKLQGTTDSGATFSDLALLSLVSPSGGDLADFFGVGDQSQGQSTIVARFDSFLGDFNIDLAGVGLGYSSPNDLYMQVVTTNKISDDLYDAGPCAFNQALFCIKADVTSDGSADLLKVPEPGSLALLGIGLLGFAGARRRYSK